MNAADGAPQPVTPFKKVDTTQAPRDIINRVLDAEENLLLIPPRFEELDLEIGLPKQAAVQIGLFSSGSTGDPKCIWNTRQNLLLNGEFSREAFGLSHSDRVLIIASPWHVAGLTWALMAQLAGVPYKMVVPHTKESDQWSSIIRDFQPTHLFTVPTVLRYLAQQSDWSCRNIAYGGASIEPDLYDQMAEHGTVMYQAYGQTEAGGLIAVHKRLLGSDPYEFEAICCGKPPRGIMLECDSTDVNEPAPIRLLSETAVYDDWYDTGDVGYLNEAGDLHITGRKHKKHGNCNMITAVTSVAHK
jgi:O-succinylbenzoic acid--CoA ligase